MHAEREIRQRICFTFSAGMVLFDDFVFEGLHVKAEFAAAREKVGLRVRPRKFDPFPFP
jgi:hypothetical protein